MQATESERLECDLEVAGFLSAQGHKFLGVERIGPNRFGFRFADADGRAEKDAAAYFDGAAVGAFEYASGLRRMKDVLYAQKHNPAWTGDIRNGKHYDGRK